MRGDLLFKLLSYLKKLGYEVRITTNATLLSNCSIKELALYNLDALNVSVDGNEGVHDNLRGKGTHKLVFDNLKKVSNAGVPITIQTTVLKCNYLHLVEILKSVSKFKGVRCFLIQPFNEMFVLGSGDLGFDLSAEDQFVFKDVLKNFLGYARATGISTNARKYLDDLENHHPRRNHFCTAYIDSCVITSYGDVLACWGKAEKIFGDINKESFSSIWESERLVEFRKTLKENRCKDCLLSCYV